MRKRKDRWKKKYKEFEEWQLQHPNRARILRMCSAAVVVSVIWVLGWYTSQKTQKRLETQELMEEADSDTDNESSLLSRQNEKKIGSLYELADNYEAVYDRVAEKQDSLETSVETAEEDTEAETGETMKKGDRVQTDGSFIYQISGGNIWIYSVERGTGEKVGEITPELPEGASALKKVILSDHQLVVIAELEDTSLEQEKLFSTTMEDGKAEEKEKKITEADYNETRLFLYDLSNPARPGLLDTMNQEGTFEEAGRQDNKFYLVTSHEIVLPDAEKKELLNPQRLDEWVPSVDGEMVPVENIYLGAKGGVATIISSSQMDGKCRVLDEKILLGGTTCASLTENSLYVCTREAHKTDQTDVTRFQMEEGILKGVAVGTVDGQIRKGGIHQGTTGTVLVSESESQENGTGSQVSVWNDNMELEGTLNQLAKNETLDDVCYENSVLFVSTVSQNKTSTLWAVDISRQGIPVLKGSHRVKGWLKQLKTWNDGQMMAIGVQGSEGEESSDNVSLWMFNISDLKNIKTQNLYQIPGSVKTVAVNNENSIMTDTQEGIIGLSVQKKNTCVYNVIKVENNIFQKGKDFVLNKSRTGDEIRGITMDGWFYLTDTAPETEIRSYRLKEIL